MSVASTFMRFAIVTTTVVSVLGSGNPSAYLPDVDTMLAPANANLNDFLAQNEAIQQGIVAKQTAHIEALEKQKKDYEHQLSLQSKSISNVSDTIDTVKTDISALETANKEVLKVSKHLKKGNQVLREAIRVMIPKMKTATKFLQESMSHNDTKEERDLLVPAPEKPSLDNFLKMMGPLNRTRAVEKKKTMSLLEQGRAGVEADKRAVKAKTPTDLIDDLQNKIKELSSAGEEGQVHMQANFMAAYEVGGQQLKEKNDQLAELIQARSTMADTQKSLFAAQAHLGEMKTGLEQRLEALQTFAGVSSSIVDDALKNAAAVTEEELRKAGLTEKDLP